MSCTSITLRSSTVLSNGFNLLRPRSNGFAFLFRGSEQRYHTVPDRTRRSERYGNGSRIEYRITALRLRTIGFPTPRPLTRLELATTQDSPARDSRRNPQRRSPGLATSLALIASTRVCAYPLRGNLPTCFGLFSHLYRGPFQFSFRVLVHYRPPDVFRLGMSASHLRLEIPVQLTLFTATGVCSPTGPSPSLAASSKAIRLYTLRYYPLHISAPFRVRIQIGLCPFHSPLLRVSLLLSLPAPTMMLRFSAFPLRARACNPSLPFRLAPVRS